MKKCNQQKTIAILNYLAGLCFLIVAIFNHLDEKDSSIMFLIVGCAFVCLGTVNVVRMKR